MKKAKRDRNNALLATFVFLIFAISFTVGSLVAFKIAHYVLMLVLCGLSAICYYAFVVFMFKFSDARAAIDLLYIMGFSGSKEQRKLMTLAEISQIMGWNKKSTKNFIEKCRKKGYMG